MPDIIQEDAPRSYTIKRLRWDEFEITCDGKTVTIKRGDPIKGCPNCFKFINDYYGAVKAAHGHLNVKI